jgi:alkanesulfonate monooxygenase SsuD/methylene tetrahydromethanopterin reductase-like flavin-dependent oxidoreductase (luciferase family)
MINAASLVSIGLPHDGESFLDGTPAQCADRLERLRAMGYNVPEYAINTLREESEAA